MIICVCDKSGSGKSTLSKKLKEIYKNKLIYIDVDKIAHDVLKDIVVQDD